jgi:hypothetical protein
LHPETCANETEQPVVAELGSHPAKGTVLVNLDGSFRYTPPTGFVGTTSFRVRARDRLGARSDPMTVTIRVV